MQISLGYSLSDSSISFTNVHTCSLVIGIPVGNILYNRWLYFPRFI